MKVKDLGKTHAFGYQKVVVDLGEKAFSRVEWTLMKKCMI